MAKNEIKLSKDDPALKAMNELAEILEPFSREQQLRALAQACIALKLDDYARQFLTAAQRENDDS